jgi:hypothetical protein
MGQTKKYQRITVANAKAEASEARAERAAEKAFPEQNRIGSVMEKRSLRVTKWLSSTPVIGVCSPCNKELRVPMTALTKTKDARINLQQQFDQPKCDVAPESRR